MSHLEPALLRLRRSLSFTLQQGLNVFNSMLWGDSDNMIQSIESTQKLHHLLDVFSVWKETGKSLKIRKHIYFILQSY